MKWFILPAVFIVLIFLYWLTSKDRSPSAMIESITSDFKSIDPNPLEIKETFRGGYGGGRHGGHGNHGSRHEGGSHRNHGGSYGGYRGSYRSYGVSNGWRSWWPFYDIDLEYPEFITRVY